MGGGATFYTLCTLCTLYSLFAVFTPYTLYALYMLNTRCALYIRTREESSPSQKGKMESSKRRKGNKEKLRTLFCDPIPRSNQTARTPARTHARHGTTRNDFPVGLTLQPPITQNRHKPNPNTYFDCATKSHHRIVTLTSNCKTPCTIFFGTDCAQMCTACFHIRLSSL